MAQTLADFLAAQGATANNVIVSASSNAPGPVAEVGAILGSQAAYTSSATVYAILLDVNLENAPSPL